MPQLVVKVVMAFEVADRILPENTRLSSTVSTTPLGAGKANHSPNVWRVMTVLFSKHPANISSAAAINCVNRRVKRPSRPPILVEVGARAG